MASPGKRMRSMSGGGEDERYTYEVLTSLLCGEEINPTDFESCSLETPLHCFGTAKIFLVNAENLKFTVVVESSKFSVLDDMTSSPIRQRAVADFLVRRFHKSVENASASSVIIMHPIDQYVLDRSCMVLNVPSGHARVSFQIAKQSARSCASDIVTSTLPVVFESWYKEAQLSTEEAAKYWQNVEDQSTLRRLIRESEQSGVCFVANGSILPRAGGNDDRPLNDAVPFQSPKSLEKIFYLPHAGKVAGMLIPKGVTVITGGGYHGKSTILRALAVGIYDKVPGDGREFVVTNESSVTIRSEDGRSVKGVDISPFIDNLPSAAGIDPTRFCTSSASGSTSMAASITEAMELSPQLFLLDEDTCASNFMIRDSRMRSLIAHEPITPYIYRVNGLYKEKGLSTIVVIGGSGDWFDVQDTTIMMDNYNCLDVTPRAKSISKSFCHGRVQYNGKGLVHQLPWPGLTDESEAAVAFGRKIVKFELPTTHCSGRITAADDGHSISFIHARSEVNHQHHYAPNVGSSNSSSSSSSSSSGNGNGSASASHKDAANKLGSEYLKTVTVDLSKIEQRVSSKEGALGIALALSFIAVVLARESNGEPKSSPDSDAAAAAAANPAIGNDINCRIVSLLKRFEAARPTFFPSSKVATDAPASHGECPQRDCEILHSIHAHTMGGSDFVWPRLFEVSAALNRVRTVSFT